MGVTARLNKAFLRALGDCAIRSSDTGSKPVRVDLGLPHPPRLRVYMYTLVGGFGTVRPTEYKVVLRVPGQPVGKTASFDHSDGRLTLLAGYLESLDVFVLWDASLHHSFKNGSNVQVRDTTVHSAAASGWAEQCRTLSSGVTELVIACQSSNLLKALDDRVGSTGGIEKEGRWAHYLS